MTASSEQYIQHHLEHLQLNLTTWKMGDGGFWTLNLDTFFVGIITALIIGCLFRYVAVNMRTGVPGRLQNFVEVAIEFVQRSVNESYNGKSQQIDARFTAYDEKKFCLMESTKGSSYYLAVSKEYKNRGND